MSEIRFGTERLILHFDNQKPITADALSRLLSDMAKDYRRLDPRRDLILVEAHEGSLRLIFAAAATTGAIALGFMGAANTLYDFGDHIHTAMEAAVHADSRFYSRSRRPGLKSAQTILETAIGSESHFKLDYLSPDGERLIVEMDANQAKEAKARAKQAAEDAIAEQPRIGYQQTRLLADQSSSDGIGAAVDRLITSARTSADTDQSDNEAPLKAAIELMVEALRANGSGYAVEGIADRLTERGYYRIAAMVLNANGNEDQKSHVQIDH